MNSSYRRFLLKNTLKVCVALSVLFFITMQITGYRIAKKSLINGAEEYTSKVSERFDSALTHSLDLMSLFRSNRFVEDYVESDTDSSFTRIELISNVMSPVNSMPALECDVAFARIGDDYAISKFYEPLDRFFDTYGIDKINLDTIADMFKDPLRVSPLVYISEANGSRYFTVILCDIKSYAKPYIIFCVYDLDSLIGTLPEKSSLLICLDSKPLYCTSEFADDKLAKLAEGQNSLMYSTVVAYSDISTLLGQLKYMLIMSKVNYFAIVNQYTVLVLIGFLVFFLLSLIFSTKIAQKSYNPIKKIIDQLYSLNLKKNDEDIEYISSAISLLAERNRDLSSMVNASRKKLADKFVGDLMKNLLTPEQIRLGLDTYIPSYDKKLPLALIIADANIDYSADDTEAPSIDILIQQVFAREFSEAKFFNFSVMSPFVYCILVSVDDYDGISERVRKMLLNSETELGITIHSTLSAPITSWDDLPNAFFSMYTAHSIRDSFADSKTIITDASPEISLFYSPEIENRITDYCVHYDDRNLKKILEMLVSENFKTEEMFNKRKSQLSLLLYALCMRILTTINLDSEAVFGNDFNIYLEISLSENPEDFLRLLQFVFSTIMQHIASLKSVHESQYSEKMLNFIHSNYNKNISLLDLAEYMNMSQGYVSRLFKKLNHSNFKDYLTQIRINKAAQMLCDNPQDSIADIAKNVGFNSSDAFSKAFVKVIGIKPGEYRKNCIFE